jgi:hypothetical protein
VGQLPAAMPETVRATDQLLRSGCPPEARHRAPDLLLTLAAVECHATSGTAALTLPELLRDLVIRTKRLVGGTWLDAHAEEAAPFTSLRSSLHAPPLAELDRLLVCLLSDRFGLPEASRQLAPSPLTAGRPQLARIRALDQAVKGRPRPSSDLREPVPSPATAVAVPTWICLLRRVNLGMQRDSRFAGRRRSAG